MKKRLLQLALTAGVLAVAAAIGQFYIVPAVAQTVRAAITQDRDARGRNAYQIYNLSCGYVVGLCSADLPAVPAGKRLIIDHVTGEVDSVGAGDIYRITLWAKNQTALAYIPFAAPNMTTNNLYAHAFAQEIFAAFDAGQVPQLNVNSNGATGIAWQATVSGYTIDIP